MALLSRARCEAGWLSRSWIRSSCAVSLTLAAFSCVTAARAQNELAPSRPAQAITLPKLKVDSRAEYPETARRAGVDRVVQVDLVLEIDIGGLVQDAKVLEPRGHGFDEAALAAARKLVFEPAKREGRPVVARINFRYVFELPPTKLTGRVLDRESDTPVAQATVTVRDATNQVHTVSTQADGSWSLDGLPPGNVRISVSAVDHAPRKTDERLERGEETTVFLRLDPVPATGASGSGEAPVEIVVEGERPPREVTRRTLARDELRRSPGSMGDALMALQNLPGIARPPPFAGVLLVRGSAPQETLVHIDGTEVPLVYHFGGLSSVVPTEIIDEIDFFPGSFGTQYGRAMGGIVDVALRPPKLDGFRGMVENSVLGLRLLAEGPIPIAPGLSFLASGQRSWLDVVLPLMMRDASRGIAFPVWADYQLGVRKTLGSDSSLRLLLFGSDDALKVVNPIPFSTDPTFGGALGYHTNFWRLQARFETRPTPDTTVGVTAAYGRDLISTSIGTNSGEATLRPLSGRAELSQKLGSSITANLGLDLLYQPYELALQLPPPNQPGAPAGAPGQLPVQSTVSESMFRPGAYTELEITPWQGARVVPGFRADYDDVTDEWDFAPRISMRQALTPGYPTTALKGGFGVYYQPPDVLETAPRFGQEGLTSSRSTHLSFGFEQEFTQNIDLSMDVFYKTFDRLVVPGNKNSGSGQAYGVEWLLRHKLTDDLFGWISYTLSRSERRQVPGDPLTPFRFDQTHVLTLLGNYRLGGGWQLGARFRLTSGDLYTPVTTGAYNATVGTQLGVAEVPPYGSRLPMFDQLDLRIERQLKPYRGFTWTWFLDVQNVYVANNPLGITYNYNYTESAPVNGLPILPIIGVRGEY